MLVPPTELHCAMGISHVIEQNASYAEDCPCVMYRSAPVLTEKATFLRDNGR
jgi:hypothetical protein